MGSAARNGWLPSLLRILVGVALALIFGEGALRQFYCLRPGYDNLLGPGIGPGRVRYGLEGFGTSYWTEHNLRRKQAPDAARPAVLALGDSFTEALGVDDEDVYTHRLEHRLEERGAQFQVLNVGHAGSSLADYIALAPRYKAWFPYTWAIVQLRAGDVTKEAWDARASYAHFTRGSTGNVEVTAAQVVQHSALWFKLLPLRQNSMLLTFGIIRAHAFLEVAAHEPPLFRGGRPATVSIPDSPEDAAPDDWPIADELALLNRAYDGRVTVVYLAEFDSAAPSTSRPVERLVASACASLRLSFVNIRQHYPAFATIHVSPFGFSNSGYNFGHMNALGHHALADDLDAELARLQRNGIL